MSDRHQNPPYWADRPDAKPFSVEVTNRDGKRWMALTVGNCAIALFRKRPDLDYLAVHHESGEWTFIFDKQPLIYWMGGLSLHREGEHMLRVMERKSGVFADKYGFNPDCVIEDYPSQNELDVYIQYETERDLHAELSEQLKQDLEND